MQIRSAGLVLLVSLCVPALWRSLTFGSILAWVC